MIPPVGHAQNGHIQASDILTVDGAVITGVLVIALANKEQR